MEVTVQEQLIIQRTQDMYYTKIIRFNMYLNEKDKKYIYRHIYTYIKRERREKRQTARERDREQIIRENKNIIRNRWRPREFLRIAILKKCPIRPPRAELPCANLSVQFLTRTKLALIYPHYANYAFTAGIVGRELIVSRRLLLWQNYLMAVLIISLYVIVEKK